MTFYQKQILDALGIDESTVVVSDIQNLSNGQCKFTFRNSDGEWSCTFKVEEE